MREHRSILTTAAMLEPSVLAATATSLQSALRDAGAPEIVAAALRMVGRGRVAAIVSGADATPPLLRAISEVDPTLPVLLVDGGLASAESLIQTLGLKDVRAVPRSGLDRALAGFDGWITGDTKETADAERAVVETDGLHLTFNPLVGAREAVDAERARSTQEARWASAPSLNAAWAASIT